MDDGGLGDDASELSGVGYILNAASNEWREDV